MSKRKVVSEPKRYMSKIVPIEPTFLFGLLVLAVTLLPITPAMATTKSRLELLAPDAERRTALNAKKAVSVAKRMTDVGPTS